ncbi:tetratricopeptide repeat protein [Amphritea pacifica]|uniref:Sel1 repeat family protein n=1 Tax=Amphritea pacifica TaxID=2811233 RepID=A0ABS2WDQ7_9GAMM|nr:tetratricopeptide repeat protein [Amphritea pacifica]MBN0989497.1 sel1 repeat family protein [Amphritea pacifica]MBN1005097.1 sel1 repeat family protein [Amphritea pacifica]
MVYDLKRTDSWLAVLVVAMLLPGCATFTDLAGVKDNPQAAKQTFSQGLDVTQGRGTEQDYRQGVTLFREAAMNGSAEGAYMAGMSYLTGRGVETSFTEAAHWLDLAARKDHPGALYQLGVLYMNGRGVDKNRLWAGFLLSRAADLGHQQAIFDLGVVYARGLGLPQSPAAAWYWFSQAEKRGVPLATELKNRMYSLSSPSSRQYMTRIMAYNGGRVDRSTTLFLQLRLQQLGYDSGTPDGIWGVKTSYAYRRFSRQELLLSDLEINWQNLQLIRDF